MTAIALEAVLGRPDIRAVLAVANEHEDVLLVLTAMADARVLWASAGLTALLGYAPEEVFGADALSFLHPDDVPAAARDRLTAQRGETVARDYRVRHRDGQWVMVRRITWVSQPDVVVGVIVANRTWADR